MKDQGFTLIEVLIVIGCLGTVITIGGVLIIGRHFISKFW